MRSPDGPSKLFVGEIGDNRKSDISRLFSKYGEISTIYVDDYKHFAFVEYTSASDAQRALKHTNNKTVNGAKLRVEYARPDRPMRDSRRASSREHSPKGSLYNHIQVTANRLPPMHSVRHSFHQHHPSSMMASSSTSRGRSLTPPSLKQNSRVSSMNHVRTQDFYPPFYPPHPAMYTDPAFYRAYGDPYLMQRLPPGAFLPPRSSPPPSSASRSYRNMYSSSNSDHYPPVASRKRSRRSRSPNRRRPPTPRRNRSSRERKRQRRTPPSPSPQQRRERGPQTPPPSSSSHRSKKRMHSNSEPVPSISEQKSSTPSASDDEREDDKQSNSRRSEDNDSDRPNSKRRTDE